MPKTTVYYDGECPLCRAEIAHYQRKDTDDQLQLVDVADPDTALPDGLDRDAALARFHVATGDGKVLSGAAAFVELWGQIPGWRLLARLGRLPGMSFAMELTYRGFLRLRPMLVRVFVALTRARRTP